MRKETTRHHQKELDYKARMAKNKQRRKDRAERKKTGQIIHMPHTLETLRVPDETIPVDDDQELMEEEENDEVADIFNGDRIPKILLTVADRVCPRTFGFCKELAKVIPNTTFFHRRRCDIKKLMPKAIEKGYTCLLVINEDHKKPNGMLVCHLPNGPTALFKMTNVKTQREIKGVRKSRIEQVIPQLVVNRFQTRLGIRVARILSALFPVKEATIARAYHRAVTLHNQRDYIFFRSHRFKVEETKDNPNRKRDRVLMQELGPRFTLKLRSVQSGTFDSKFGEYEWVHKRHEMDTSRRKFHL